MNTNNEQNLNLEGAFAESIRDFRSAVSHIAERETARPVAADWLTPARRRHRRAQVKTGVGIGLGWACAALLCLSTLPISLHSHPVPVHPVTQAAAAVPPAESDTALLDQVDSNLSSSVPSSLAPLAEAGNPDVRFEHLILIKRRRHQRRAYLNGENQCSLKRSFCTPAVSRFPRFHGRCRTLLRAGLGWPGRWWSRWPGRPNGAPVPWRRTRPLVGQSSSRSTDRPHR